MGPMLAPFAYAPTAALAPSRAAKPSMSLSEEFTIESKPWTSSEISDEAGLTELAKKLNPTVGFWDPLGIGGTSPETIGWFRHAEIKHGRVAMAAFVGYCLQSNGVVFPWNICAPLGSTTATVPTLAFSDIAAAGGPADQWDALQILGVVGFLEMW